MKILYNILVSLYFFAVFVAQFFNKKAKLFIKGRADIFQKIKKQVNSNDKIAWFHAASLGEFEQGYPVMEAFKKKWPEYKILLTFFSPSGYEIRKNYSGADYIFYLPMDFPANAKKFIALVNPKIVFFIKYEFWYNYLSTLKKKNIPVYLFSAIFREDQIFFKWYGTFYRNILTCFSCIFVQNENSKKLLSEIDIKNVTVCGDTRFDRVFEIAMNVKEIPVAAAFSKDAFVIVAGSSWEKDEELLATFFNSLHATDNVKIIIAPHEIKPLNIERIEKIFIAKSIKFSEASEENVIDKNLLIIDNIGMLSSLYKYGKIAFIGGGFGKGIHNTLEAAIFGMPVLFGPNYHKFQEAKDLIEIGAAFSISSQTDIFSVLNTFLNNKEKLKVSSEAARNYVKNGRGGTEVILGSVEM
ncbi:MAG: 3-deoxy-D-manno-octulosonic acid transferase [Bacteroidetes bacterium RIFOXYA12_FULL_35_11]|nr:MAG: 3-deoxy-D-manno-octulosonic acid transferase [Bacteroidetes bacterium GWF2_35_48]OFY73427.1 MAG: 3-deoxy-D-manno-octulosonic acid transferase [Bacteroidetes bacterium RIFOXYA12_FULL_35_11]OFY94989.1 MAG: 3-deoxy-D-manno-octulosonic acid transferase [Bacteroidetes bacterium RIFOXYC12_FULL_35_7]HBX51276.1 3-deoxy-D-manno-octulosonic acid transferase [Bacteroidales bacterium]